MIDRSGQQLGSYRLLRLLGRGGFADVYLGEHIHLTTFAAIKVLQMRLGTDDSTAFLTEARTIAHLEHPHIVRVLDFGILQGTPFLVMNYAPHGTLRQRHPKGARVPLESVVSYVQQVADALSYAHSQNLIHRDIKPENLLLDQQQKLLLSDFGIALLNQSSRYLGTQEVIGTVAYMAPEQLQGKPGFASDQYALGIIAYEWLSGGRPFEGSFLELFSQHMVVPPIPLSQKMPGFPSDVDEVVLRALAKDPQARFPTIAAFADALRQATTATLRKPGAFSTSQGQNTSPQLKSPTSSPSKKSPPPSTSNRPREIPSTAEQPSVFPPTLLASNQTPKTPPAAPVNKQSSGPTPTLSMNTPVSASMLPHSVPPRTSSGNTRRPARFWGGLLALLLVLSCAAVYAIQNGRPQQSQSATQAQTSPAQQHPASHGTATKTKTPMPKPTPTPQPSSGQVLYQADWSKDLAGWKGSKQWKWIEGGMLGSDQSDVTIASSPFNPSRPDYAVEAKIQYLRGSYFGVTARGGSNNQAYVCQIGTSTNPYNNKLYIGTLSIVSNTTLKNQDLSQQQIDATVPHTYQIAVKGNSISCSIDGRQIIQTLDNTYQDAGQVGVYSYDAQIDVSSFKVIAV